MSLTTAQKTAPVTTRPIEKNPLVMLKKGAQPASILPRHRRTALVGNLFFEYAQNVPALRGVVRSGRDIAEFLELEGLIFLDKTTDRYTWKTEPLTKADFLELIRPAQMPSLEGKG